MLTRIWMTHFDLDRLDDLIAFAGDVSAPMFAELPGCLGHVYAVEGDRWITQTFWDSQANIERAEASAGYQDVVTRILGLGTLVGEQTTDVFEVIDYQPPPRDEFA